MVANEKVFVLRVENAPAWLSVSNIGYIFRNYLKDGYDIKEVFENLSSPALLPPSEDE